MCDLDCRGGTDRRHRATRGAPLDGNTSPQPPASARPETVAAALAVINTYAHGGHPQLLHAIAEYAGVGPDQIVLGAGADDLIMICARAFAVDDERSTGRRTRAARIRTFSKAFSLAGARIGYALADRDTAAELNARQSPAPVSTLAVALALAGLATPPDVTPVLEERERFAGRLRTVGLDPLPSATNFLFVPIADAPAVGDTLLRRGLLVRAYEDGIRITVRDAADDDLLVEALGG